MANVVVDAGPWPARRERVTELAQRWDFASDVLRFYDALLGVQERASAQAARDLPEPETLAAYVAEHVIPLVVETSLEHGPTAMQAAIVEHFHEADFEVLVEAWLRGEETSPIERFLARASAEPVLEALGAAAAGAFEVPRDARHCPRCGGLPQLSTFAPSPEDLVTAHRYLLCSRCSTQWPYARLTCASCGETETTKLVVYGEVGASQAERAGTTVRGIATHFTPATADVRFPHLRVDGCTTCSRYLLTVDLERDGRAVPLVDEIAAIPLDLYAKERGFIKIVPNLMGM